MLNVQKYLLSGKTLDDLHNELAIKATVHSQLPLVILNYSQIDSKKTDPIVRECRGLVLEADAWKLIARGFSRFFNWGEVQEEMKLFDFDHCCAHTKEDGSLVLLYNYHGEWRANTRGSFAEDLMQFQNFTWKEAILRAMGLNSYKDIHLDPNLTYVCEFCSIWNKVVRKYPDPKLFLLTAFNGEAELTLEDCDGIMSEPGGHYFHRPQRFDFNSIEEAQEYLARQAETDATYEGVVLRDQYNHRWKIKSSTYLGLHRLKGEVDNIFNPKHLLPFILTGNADELLLYFPEAEPAFRNTEQKANDAFQQLQAIWEQYHTIPTQKEFALSIVGKTPFTGLLFAIRKEFVENQTLDHLKKAWRDASQLIIKVLF